MKLDFAALSRPELPQPLPKARGQVGTPGTPATARVAARSAAGDRPGTTGDNGNTKAVDNVAAGGAKVAMPAARPQASPPCPQAGQAANTHEINVSPTSPLVPSDLAQDAGDADDWREAFEERAAIMEFDGGMTRIDAEAAALALVYAQRSINTRY